MNAAALEPDVAMLCDVVDSKVIVETLRESLRACLVAANLRDGVGLSLEQIERFVRECANNAAQTLMLTEVRS